MGTNTSTRSPLRIPERSRRAAVSTTSLAKSLNVTLPCASAIAMRSPNRSAFLRRRSVTFTMSVGKGDTGERYGRRFEVVQRHYFHDTVQGSRSHNLFQVPPKQRRRLTL